MKISLVIPAHNEESHIGTCLDFAIKNSNGGFHEIIVVDNASTDKTSEIARGKGVKVVLENKKGLTKARQRGLEEAGGDYIAYIDADTQMHDKWLDTAKDIFKKYPNVVCISGPYKYHDGNKWKNKIMEGVWWISAPITYFFVGYMVLGGNFVAKKQALLDMGGFDQNITFYGEDTDIARRLSKHGKVKFKMNFHIHSSSRRLNEEGLIKTNIVYALNFIWQVLFHKPYTKKYKDIRPK